MENAILHAGIEELNTIKEYVLELNGYREKNSELIKEETRLEKLIFTKEKYLNDEIETTLKKRKSELMLSYQTQLTNLNTRTKRIKTKKEKDKGVKVSERITEETAGLRDHNKEITLEIKSKMKADKTPRFCNTTLFYSFFMPKSLVELLIFLLGLLIVFLVIPFGIYLAFFAEKFNELALALIYLIMILVVGTIYLTINNKIKERHLETIREIRKLRHQLRKNRREIQGIQKNIKKDSDESTYGLQQYDEELAEIEAESRRVAEEEKKELGTFETVTTPQIKEEINRRYAEELNALRERYQEVCAEQKITEETIKEISLMLSKQYEAYLGKDMLTVAKLDKLIARIQKGEAADIGEALALENKK